MTENLVSKLFLILFTGASISTSAFAGYNVVNQLQPSNPVSSHTTAAIETVSSPDAPTPTPQSEGLIPNSENSQASNTKLALNSSPTPFPTIVPSTAKNNSPATVNPNACIITLFGGQYDVAPLRNSHPGGDIFICGTDMTASYQSQHGTNLSRMARYAISSSGTTTSSSSGTSSGTSPTSYHSFSDDHEDLEDEDDLQKSESEHEEEHEEKAEYEKSEDHSDD